MMHGSRDIDHYSPILYTSLLNSAITSGTLRNDIDICTLMTIICRHFSDSIFLVYIKLYIHDVYSLHVYSLHLEVINFCANP